MSTRAIGFLKSKGIPFKPVTYDHQKKGAEFAAKAIGFPLEKTIKTLVVDVGPKGYVFVLMPGNKQLDLKRLSKALGVKRAQMADSHTAEKLTGYLTGGISPFGSKRRLPVIMEKSVLDYDTVAINGGQRGTLLIMDPVDIKKVSECKVLEVAKGI
ncbi:MAG: aminoacyl-tRNA deacylase [Deltaproteobacteria bacterium]|nr:aminoacyl-tRNA deacylase [Deltaproteobacteria bacterium]MBW1928293.1 aminoacyl-tRNA deacylase [Deltaproteobacteria bacterium]MBW2025035.1 aminoacyl-tRNA deacylase [Deltaproteobacteria bacterium]MBW2124472.1 aminoacyl-tRNA deacylase [Deltaproteobacteria bacterium]RLB21848.1 MAG: Cys-tRNA(Pro) deacylase [Deltaproteobacteria bacterium]